MDISILSPSELKEQINNQITLSLNKERKRFTLKRLRESFHKYVLENIIKKRKNPPYQFRVLIKYYDLPIKEMNDRLIEFAKLLEKSDWHVSLKTEKVSIIQNNKLYNLQIQLFEEELPPKYYTACFNLSEVPLEKAVFEKPLYKTPSKKQKTLKFKKN